jgi:hypothetical protein
MTIPDAFKNLTLDTWYKVFVYLGGFAFLASLFVGVEGITNGQLQLLSLGIFLIGIREWENRKTANWIKPPNAYTGVAALMSAEVRKPDSFGIACDILGFILIILSVVFIIIRVIKTW